MDNHLDLVGECERQACGVADREGRLGDDGREQVFEKLPLSGNSAETGSRDAFRRRYDAQ